MNELAKSDLPVAVASLVDWAHSASAAYELAQKLCETSFAPETFRNKPKEGAAAILAGAEVGLSPMAALKSFDIIQGTAAPRAIALRAIVQSQGHEVWVEESAETRAIVCGRRKNSEKIQKSTWTIDRAKKLGLLGKYNWKNQPGTMLVARATSELCRLIASDAILGIGYSVEELDGGDQVILAENDRATPIKRTAQRAPIAQPEPELEPPDESITDAQLKKLHASYNEAGITERPKQLEFASATIDRPITTSKDLSKRETSMIIDALESGAGVGVWGSASTPAPPTDYIPANSADYAMLIRTTGGIEPAISLARQAGFKVLSEVGLKALTGEQIKKVLSAATTERGN